MITDLERRFISVAGDRIRITCLEQIGAAVIDTWFDYYAAAAMFLGALKQANGVALDEIVTAASEAERAKIKAAMADVLPNGYSCSVEPFDLDTMAFFAAITNEALWRGRGDAAGPKWADDHAAFKLRDGKGRRPNGTPIFVDGPWVCLHCNGEQCLDPNGNCPVCTGTLIVPPLRLATGGAR